MKEARAYLLHIRDALERIASYTSDGRVAFMGQTLIQDAVIRNLEIIGEAVKKLPKEGVSTQHFQIFYLSVVKQQPLAKVAKALGVNSARV